MIVAGFFVFKHYFGKMAWLPVDVLINCHGFVGLYLVPDKV